MMLDRCHNSSLKHQPIPLILVVHALDSPLLICLPKSPWYSLPFLRGVVGDPFLQCLLTTSKNGPCKKVCWTTTTMSAARSIPLLCLHAAAISNDSGSDSETPLLEPRDFRQI